MKSVRLPQVVLIAALFAAGAGLSVWAAGESRRSGRLPQFYQNEFVPAVMLTCGHGYQNIDWRDHEALASFLMQRVDTFSCQSLPQSAIIPLDFFQRMSRYLEYTVAGAWRVFGLSWRTLGVLHGILGGLVAVALYGIMRLGLNWPLACVVSLMVLTSPLNLTYVPELRDYSKTPFLLALVLIMGLLVKHLTPPTRLFFLAATAGIVGGVGFGFRTDLAILVLPFALAVLCFRRSTEPSRWLHAAVGITGVAVFVVAFVVAAWPVIRGYSKGGTTAHVALLGFASFFDAPLGVEARHYELSPLYLDAYEEAVVRDYARRTSVEPSAFLIGSEEYGWQSARYLGLVVTTFPADIVIRAIASTGRIIDIGFTDVYGGVPAWMRTPIAVRAYAFRQNVVASVPWLGLIATVAAALGLLCADLRVGVFYILLTIFMTASAALQFHERHFFYLEFVGWWAVAFAGSGLIRLCWTAVLKRTLPEWLTVPRLSKAVIALGCVSVAGGAMVWGARAYQQQSLDRLFARYLEAPSAVVSTETTAGVNDKLLLRPTTSTSGLRQPEAFGASAPAEYLKLELMPSLCDALLFDATVRYAATSPAVDFTHQIRVPMSSTVAGSTVIVLPVFPAYSTQIRNLPESTRFEGIEVDRNEASCVRSIRRVPDLPASNALMTAILPSDWHAAQHYQTLAGIERRYDGAAWMTDIYSVAPNQSVNRSILDRPVESIVAATTYRSQHVRFVGSLGVEMSGGAETPNAYLVQTGDRPLQAGRYAIVEGQLYAGGLTFGLLRNQVWYQQARILRPGRFVAVAKTTGEGLFSIVLANQNDSRIMPTSFRVDRIGWIGGSSVGSSSRVP